jgi:putative PIN family toxin of toxin-antitoxin system
VTLRAVLDPNVLVAAAIAPRGTCRRTVDAWLDGECHVFVSPKLLEELHDVLVRPKFRAWITLDEAVQFVSLVAQSAIAVEDPPVQQPLTADRDDDYLVALAQVARADCLVSGDADLTQLAGAHPPVLTPRDFLDRIMTSTGTEGTTSAQL